MASALPFLHRHSFSSRQDWVGFPSHSISCFTCFSVPPNPTSGTSIPVASSPSSSENSSTRRRQKSRAKEDSQQERKKQPSVAEIERALGVGKSDNTSKPRRKESPGLLDLIELDPFGEEEGTLERKLREAGDWIIERTERGERSETLPSFKPRKSKENQNFGGYVSPECMRSIPESLSVFYQNRMQSIFPTINTIAHSGRESLALLLLKLFPVWCFFLLLASGVIQLPFPVPFLDEYM